MKYNIYSGIREATSHIKRRLAIGLTTAGVVVAGLALPAAAASGGYCSQNGCEQSLSNTQCAGHGAFGAFGKDNNFAGGASGDRTAYANSTLCGSPSPNSSAATLGDHPN